MRNFIFLVLALFWTALISYLCLVSSSELPIITWPYIDKVVHVGFHFGFVLIWFLFFKNQFKFPNLFKSLLMAFVFSVFFGLAIEILQEVYTSTRAQDVRDVFANTVGASIALIVILISDKKILSKL